MPPGTLYSRSLEDPWWVADSAEGFPLFCCRIEIAHYDALPWMSLSFLFECLGVLCRDVVASSTESKVVILVELREILNRSTGVRIPWSDWSSLDVRLESIMGACTRLSTSFDEEISSRNLSFRE